MQGYSDRPYKIMIAAAIVVPALLFFLTVWRDYNAILNENKNEAIRTTTIFEQHALNVFETHQLVVERINDRLKNMSWEEIGRSTWLHAYLRDMERQYPQIESIWIVDASGIIRNASRPLPAAPVSLADRDYFKALREKNSGLFIGNLVKGKVTGALNFNVACRRIGKGEAFDGVIAVSASPEYFSGFWANATAGSDSTATMVRSDGAVLARKPEIEPNHLTLPPDSKPMQVIRNGAQGSYIGAAVHGGVERIISFRKLEKYNVYLFYGISMKSVFAEWQKHFAYYGFFFGLAIAVLLLSALALQRHVQNEQAAQKALLVQSAELDAARINADSDRRFLATVMEALPIGVAITDTRGAIKQPNRAFEQIWGGTQPVQSIDDYTVYKAWWADTGKPVIPQEWAAAIAVRKGETIVGQLMRIQRFDGSEAFVINSASPVRDAEGAIVACVIAMQDITELKQAEKALREKDQLMIQQGRLAAMGEMINNIAHQWRQPLNALGLNIQRLSLYYELGSFDKEFLDTSVGDAMLLINHMSKTIDDFRNFFKPDKEEKEFRISQVVDNAVQLVRASFDSQSIKIVMHCTEDPVVRGYPNEYSQVILNVLNNAKDALVANKTANPEVVITIGMHEGRSAVTISDNAGGIPDEVISKVFDPHFSTKGPQGSGIGLFMAKNIIERNMHGKLSVHNNGAGAEFSIQV